MSDKKVIFAHGLEGSPQGNKATYLREVFDAITPELFHLGLMGRADVLVGLLVQNPGAILVGSSMGGLAALVASNKRPNLVGHLLLLAPAVGVAHDEQLWEQVEETRPGLLEEVAKTEGICVPADLPCSIIHGLADDVVNPLDVVALCKRSPSSKLIFVHDDHALSNSRNLIITTIDSLISC